MPPSRPPDGDVGDLDPVDLAQVQNSVCSRPSGSTPPWVTSTPKLTRPGPPPQARIRGGSETARQGAGGLPAASAAAGAGGALRTGGGDASRHVLPWGVCPRLAGGGWRWGGIAAAASGSAPPRPLAPAPARAAPTAPHPGCGSGGARPRRSAGLRAGSGRRAAARGAGGERGGRGGDRRRRRAPRERRGCARSRALLAPVGGGAAPSVRRGRGGRRRRVRGRGAPAPRSRPPPPPSLARPQPGRPAGAAAPRARGRPVGRRGGGSRPRCSPASPNSRRATASR
ncbi:hypothetical protein SHIRM173S_05048 [Streptomyces hirsutus]